MEEGGVTGVSDDRRSNSNSTTAIIRSLNSTVLACEDNKIYGESLRIEAKKFINDGDIDIKESLIEVVGPGKINAGAVGIIISGEVTIDESETFSNEQSGCFSAKCEAVQLASPRPR